MADGANTKLSSAASATSPQKNTAASPAITQDECGEFRPVHTTHGAMVDRVRGIFFKGVDVDGSHIQIDEITRFFALHLVQQNAPSNGKIGSARFVMKAQRSSS